MNRICIYTKDLQIITGKSDKSCRATLKMIHKLNNKQKHQPVTIKELANYLGIEVSDIQKAIK